MSGKNISDISIISQKSRERILPIDFPGCKILLDHGINSVGLSNLAPKYRVRRHCSKLHTVIFTFDGQGIFRSGKNKQVLKKDTLWLLPAGIQHDYGINEGSWGMMWFFLEDTGRWRHLYGKEPQEIFSGQSLRIIHVLEGLFGEVYNYLPDHVEMAALFAGIIARFLDRRLGVKGHGKPLERLSYLWHVVGQDMSRNWKVEDMAEVLHLSAAHLHRLVRNEYECGPMQMLFKIRMQFASDLLKKTSYKLDTIAAMSGYQTAFSLSKAFKRCYGMSPRDYRTKAKDKD